MPGCMCGSMETFAPAWIRSISFEPNLSKLGLKEVGINKGTEAGEECYHSLMTCVPLYKSILVYNI